MPEDEIHDRIHEDSLGDILGDRQFRAAVTTKAAHRARGVRRRRQALAVAAGIMLMATSVLVGPLSDRSGGEPSVGIANDLVTHTSPEQRVVVVTTRPSSIETVHTHPTGLVVLSTEDSPYSIPRINDAQLLQLLAHRDPLLMRKPDGELQLIMKE